MTVTLWYNPGDQSPSICSHQCDDVHPVEYKLKIAWDWQ